MPFISGNASFDSLLDASETSRTFLYLVGWYCAPKLLYKRHANHCEGIPNAWCERESKIK